MLQDLLEIEADPIFSDSACPSTEVLLWPPIRNIFFRLIVSDWFYSSQPLMDPARKRAFFRAGKVAARATLHNLLRPPQRSSVMFLATGAGLYVHNGHSRNRYTHCFSEAIAPDYWSLEGLFDYDWPLPREGGRLSFSFPALQAIGWASRMTLRDTVRRQVEDLVNCATQRAEDLFEWSLDDQRKAWLIDYSARLVAAYPGKRRWLERWLRKVRPRLLVVEEGCYGHMSILNATAREMDVTVAEFQHGVVAAGHDVYNLSPVLAQSEALQRSLPHYFLAYGDWWNRQFNAPVEKVVIGNPHRDAVLNRRLPDNPPGTVILILGEGRETRSYLEFCRELAASLGPQRRVVFRPHPEERASVLAKLANQKHIFEIDREPDIYTSLAQADTVIAELSTGLFDAVGLASRIYLWNTPKSRFGLPSHPFQSFDTLAELVSMIETPHHSDRSLLDVQGEIWASNWQQRFRTFVGEIDSPSAA